MNDSHRSPTRLIPSFPKLAIIFILFGELVHRAIGLVRHPDVPHVWDIMAWIAAIALIVGTYRQVQFIKLRVISDTMRIRLERMAPQDRLDAISRLSIPDLVVLRLASDAELAEFLRKLPGGHEAAAP